MATDDKPIKGVPFGDAAHYAALRVDNNDLFWHGKKVKTGGWSVAEKLTATGIVVAGTIGIFGNIDKIKPNVCLVADFDYCKQYKAAAQLAPNALPNNSPEMQKAPNAPAKQ
jgi:hypothetical protein